MILSITIMMLGFLWLMVETKCLTINLAYVKPEAVETLERRKHNPKIEPCRIINASYPKPEPIKLLPQYCELTAFQNKIKVEKWRYNPSYHNYGWNDPRKHDAYQQTTIGGHMVILNATSPKLYETIAEIQKTADSKPRKFVAKTAPLPLFVETVSIGSHRELDNNPIYKHPINRIVSDYTTIFHDCLCGKEWLEAHYNDHKDFEPTIELTVNEKSISFNGDFRTGKIHDFCVLNAELWERPRIKGKKIKMEATN